MRSAPSTLEQLPVYFHLITSRIRLDMFRHINLLLVHTMHLDVAKFSKSILFVLTVGYDHWSVAVLTVTEHLIYSHF